MSPRRRSLRLPPFLGGKLGTILVGRNVTKISLDSHCAGTMQPDADQRVSCRLKNGGHQQQEVGGDEVHEIIIPIRGRGASRRTRRLPNRARNHERYPIPLPEEAATTGSVSGQHARSSPISTVLPPTGRATCDGRASTAGRECRGPTRPLSGVMLKERLRQVLIDQAQTGGTTTYGELANRLALEPPNTIRRITEALEDLMAEDVAAGRPILAAICVSKARTGIPQPGFFLTAQALGVFSAIPRAPRHLPSTLANCIVCCRSTDIEPGRFRAGAVIADHAIKRI